jgi:2-desacetyl-2-hydroxyethyl bacteriochlorophyllide A dehydrogenase
MKAAVLDGPYRFRLEERPLPALEPGWALIQVHAAGICGSDIHFYTGELPVTPGSVRGHEIAGVVADPGKTELVRNQAVVVHPLLGCNECRACHRGEQQLCADLQAIGGQHPGGFAEYVAAPVQNVYPFDPDLLPMTHAVLADGVAVAVHAMNVVGLKAGESAVVLGDGAIGLLLLQVALARGGNPVILVGKHKRNLEIARRLGASYALDGVEADAISAVHDVTTDVDVVLEAVGGPKPPLKTGLRMLRKGGRLAVLGLTGATDIGVPWIDVVLGEQLIIGAMGYGTFAGEDELQQALDLMQSAKVALEPIITHQIPLADVDRGFKMMLDRTRSQAIKVVVLPHGGTS